MKSPFLSTIFLLSVLTAQYQITINQADLPSVGQSWVLFSDSGNTSVGTMSPGGANQTWNFSSGWSISDTTTYQYVNKSSLPHAANFPTANLGINVVTSLGNLEGFMQKNSSGLFLSGFYSSIPGFADFSTVNTNTVVVPVPLTFNSVFTYSQRSVSVTIYNPLFMIPAEKTITDEQITYTCDAWGTLATPSLTANVLRLRSHITGSVDSVFIDNSFTGNAFVFDNTTTYPAETEYNYVFLRNGPNAYLMSCTVDIATGAITYGDYLASSTVSIPEVVSTAKNVAYPNPVNDMLSIRLNGTGVTKLKFFNAAGQEAFNYDVDGIDLFTFSTAQFTNGLYVYVLYDANGNKVGSNKVMVQH